MNIEVGKNVRVINADNPWNGATAPVVRFDEVLGEVVCDVLGQELAFTIEEVEEAPLVDLYENLLNIDDEEHFQLTARAAIQDYIESIEDTEKRRKAAQFQWNIDKELRKVHPSQRYNRMIELFYVGVGRFEEALRIGKVEE